MKKPILATTYNRYSKALKALANKINKDPWYLSKEYHAVVNNSSKKNDGTNHRCVDVLDSNDNVIEQHYPECVGTKKTTRGKYEYVGPGNGDYILTRVPTEEFVYSIEDKHVVKHVSKTDTWEDNTGTPRLFDPDDYE